jgi:general stress protein YciG
MDRGEAGSKGGKTTVAKHGREHMAEIGAKGFATTVARHYGGDAAEYLRVQRRRAAEHGVAGFVDRLMKERLDQGQDIVSYELPVLLEPDDDLPF